jgi:hypothetical protein
MLDHARPDLDQALSDGRELALRKWAARTMHQPEGGRVHPANGMMAITMCSPTAFPKASPWVWRVVVCALAFPGGLLFFGAF